MIKFWAAVLDFAWVGETLNRLLVRTVHSNDSTVPTRARKHEQERGPWFPTRHKQPVRGPRSLLNLHHHCNNQRRRQSKEDPSPTTPRSSHQLLQLATVGTGIASAAPIQHTNRRRHGKIVPTTPSHSLFQSKHMPAFASIEAIRHLHIN